MRRLAARVAAAARAHLRPPELQQALLKLPVQVDEAVAQVRADEAAAKPLLRHLPELRLP